MTLMFPGTRYFNDNGAVPEVLQLPIHGQIPITRFNLINEPHWRHNKRDGVSNHQPHDCFLNCLFRRRSKKISKLCVTGLCKGNSPVTDEFPIQRASNAENVSIWWRHHEDCILQSNYWLAFIFDYDYWTDSFLTHFLIDKFNCTSIPSFLRGHQWIDLVWRQFFGNDNSNGRFPHISMSSMYTAHVRRTRHRVLIWMSFSKCHLGVISHRNPIKIGIIDIDPLTDVAYEN